MPLLLAWPFLLELSPSFLFLSLPSPTPPAGRPDPQACCPHKSCLTHPSKEGWGRGGRAVSCLSPVLLVILSAQDPGRQVQGPCPGAVLSLQGSVRAPGGAGRGASPSQYPMQCGSGSRTPSLLNGPGGPGSPAPHGMWARTGVVGAVTGLAATLGVADTQSSSGFSHSGTVEGLRWGMSRSRGQRTSLVFRCIHSQGPRTAAGAPAVTPTSQPAGGTQGPFLLRPRLPFRHVSGILVSPAGAGWGDGGGRTCVPPCPASRMGCWAPETVAEPSVIGGSGTWLLRGSPPGGSEPRGQWEVRGSGVKTHLVCLPSSPQGSTLRKRKMYEEFLSKVSILGQCPTRLHAAVSDLSEALPPAQPPPHPRGWPVPCVMQVWATCMLHSHAHSQMCTSVCACTSTRVHCRL